MFHIPDWLVSFSGYTFDGPTFIPVDFSAPDADTNYIDNVTVLINGQPTDYATFIPDTIDGTTYWGMGVYFDRFANGTNTIQLITTVRESDTLNDQTPYMVFSNAPQTIVIGNFVTYTNWDDLIWNNTNYTFRAQSSATNVDWEIDIYDIYGDFVNSQTGHSDDGNISWTWDLTDYTGASRADSDSDPVFYPYITITENSESLVQLGSVHPDAGGGSATMPPAAASFPSAGGWIIAYMDNFFIDAGQSGEDDYYKGVMNNLVGGPALWDISVTPYAIEYGSNYAQADRDGSWSNLVNVLSNPQYRNFYYFGHGAPDRIGGDITTFDSSNNPTGATEFPGSKAHLMSQDVPDKITVNNPLGACFYRFVFLDGCNTANGDLPDAWGIGKATNDLAYYNSPGNTRHLRPSAFVGWNTTPGGSGWGTQDNALGFRSSWMGNWSVNNGNPSDGLSDIFTFTADNYGWPPNRSPQLWSALRVYGYRNIKFNEYNRQGDWP
ncbi:MAG TPA: hypothetical protein VIK59_10660 [Verrucomicrobiae bacterium]